MNAPLRFWSYRQIETESSIWLSRLDRGLSDDERREIEQWIALDQRHGRVLMRLAALWDNLDVLRELSGLVPLPAATTRRFAWSSRAWIAAAATSVAAAGVVALLLMFSAGKLVESPVTVTATALAHPIEAHAGPTQTLMTAVGEQRSFTLPDDSVVQLNTATVVRVEFTARERRITLQSGEAQFDVRPNRNRPFVVRAGKYAVRAVGTAFNVRLGSRQDHSDDIEVIVTKGRVRVLAPAESGKSETPTAVSRGEMLVVRDAQAAIVEVPAEKLDDRLAWQRGMIIFDGQSFESALAEVERYTHVRFRIDDAALRNMRIAGSFKVGDVEGLTRSLEQNFGVRAVQSGDMIQLTRARDS